MGMFGDEITEETLSKFIKFIEENILSDVRYDIEDSLDNYIQQIVHAVKIYDAEGTCGCTTLTEEDRKFRDYIIRVTSRLEK